MANLTGKMAGLICGFKGGAIPAEAIDRSRIAVLDCVGVALAGSREPVGRIMHDFVKSQPGQGEATIWGTSDKVSATEAALANGTMSHALDYDDMNRSVLGHPSAVLVPAAFAVAEKMQCSGRKLLEGYIIGLEVMAGMGRIFGTRAYEKSWHATPVLGVLGSCASACYLLGLSYEQTLSAIGIAASEASGIRKNFSSMTKPLHAGSASRKGIWSALLARQGMTADPQSLEGTFGFLEMFGGEACAPSAEDDPCRPLEIMASGLVYKQYPCCGGLHSLLDNMIGLKQKEGFLPDQVVEIECRVHPHRLSYLDRPEPRDVFEAKFSIQYCVAVALLHGKVGFGHFTKESVARPETREVMKKVRLTSEEGLREFASEMIVRTSDGREFSGLIQEAKGSMNFPLSEGELLRKFMDCATLTMSSSQAEKAGAVLLAIDKEKNLENIVKLLSAE